MIRIRVSTAADIPAERELWALAFGDAGAYVDNFYSTYYRPERLLVLEEEGTVRAMTAWFDTIFRLPGGEEFRAAYLYAVATHPEFRSRGLSGRLLAWADGHFAALGIPIVTTVPAQPGLHCFFGRNGFRECFLHQQMELAARDLVPGPPLLTPVTPEGYGAAREPLLQGIPHICYPPEALAFQAGCCRVLQGGLFRGDTPEGSVLLCAEGAGEGRVIVKELLGSPAARRAALGDLPRILPASTWQIRGPRLEEQACTRFFGMVKVLNPDLRRRWDWACGAYLGLAFD